ncbi:hypothetical protein BCON_0836g00020 [Botryotinia convoluta]|uniref:2EXR domain-containing protein n=1 Tax=Botryotinia convoluta TaxID=54673 RepID=A0A4Z1HFN1_9HELO|nr:hypothetical protein BCON_0836g00020 [Botryotinia convoluta]
MDYAPDLCPVGIGPGRYEQLRCPIWKEALPGPRIVHLRRRLLKLSNGKTSFGYESPSTVYMAYACREAYMVVMEEYKQVFDGGIGSIAQTWFSFDIDTLYLDGGPITKHLQVEMNCVSWSSDFQKVKHLAVFSYPEETYGYSHHIRNFSMREFAFGDWLYYMLYHGSITNINRRHPLTIYNDLTVIYLQNTTASLAIYESPYDTITGRTLQRKQESFRNRYCSHSIKLGPSLANIHSLDTVRQQEAAANGGVAPFEIPIVECRTMATKAMETKLKEAAAQYQVKKNEYERKRRERGEMPNGTFLPSRLMRIGN